MLISYRVFGDDLKRELTILKASSAAEAVEKYNRTFRVPGMPVALVAAPLQW